MNWRDCLCYSVFLATDAMDVGGNSRITASTASRTQSWKSSVEQGCSEKGNNMGGQWLRLVKAALWKNVVPEEAAFWSQLNTVPCISSYPSAKDCPFVIVKHMVSWKTKFLSMHINLVLPLVNTGHKSVFLHTGIWGKITLPWTPVNHSRLLSWMRSK